MTDFTRTRSQFPLAKGYLDSAASSLTAPVVVTEMDRYYREYRANVHRAQYKEGECATREYELARKTVAAFIGADPNEVVFTPGATHSANMLYRSIEESGLAESGNVVVSALEHHAQFVPMQELARRKGLAFRVAHESPWIEGIDEATRVVGLTLASNVTGELVDVAKVAAMKGSAILVVDATAAIGHVPMDVRTLGADAVFFSGHKMLGPTGIGVLWAKTELLERLRPSVFGGHMVAAVSERESQWSPIPDRFEAGTPNIAGAIGLGKAVEYLTLLGTDEIAKHARALVASASERLAEIPGVRVLSAPPERNVGIVALVIDGIHPHDIAEILARKEVKIRAGHHCAMPIHEKLGVPATVRASVHCYSAMEDIDLLVAGVKDAKRIFGA